MFFACEITVAMYCPQVHACALVQLWKWQLLDRLMRIGGGAVVRIDAKSSQNSCSSHRNIQSSRVLWVEITQSWRRCAAALLFACDPRKQRLEVHLVETVLALETSDPVHQ